jgi:hypothetical protein
MTERRGELPDRGIAAVVAPATGESSSSANPQSHDHFGHRPIPEAAEPVATIEQRVESRSVRKRPSSISKLDGLHWFG